MATATSNEIMTAGMRLDAFLTSVETSARAVTGTHVYLVTVAIMIVASCFLLSPKEEATPYKAVSSPPVRTANKTNKPAWFAYLRFVNFAALAIFLASLVAFFQHATIYSAETPILYRFLIGWSIYLGYFFSFSGVSLLYDSMNEVEDPTRHYTPKSIEQPAATRKVVLPPPHSTPVCSDPTSFIKPPKQQPAATTTTNEVIVKELTNEQVAQLVLSNKLKDHELEKKLADCHRAVAVRRLVVASKLTELGLNHALDALPHEHADVLDYNRVFGANCEIVVGYVPLPVGMVGPMTINGASVFIPMATTEGCLVASTNRGAKAITEGGGAHATIVRDGITRAPCVRLPTATAAARLKLWAEEPHNFAMLKAAFESTTSFGKLKSCNPTVAGKNVYLRLTCFAGDAMGMNMVSKGSLAVIDTLQQQFPEIQLVALSGNMCTDKKAAATNWIEGRGKSVVVEAVIPAETVRKTLKTTVAAMVHTNIQKNLIGSAMAGAIGGFNAHASNMVTAVFLATGQDPAQNVESSNCITLLEETDTGDLWISCTMPSLEVGTVGGGTSLPAQAACLKAIGCQGGGATPGDNARQLAMVIASATMAGELSLLAALAANTLVAAHMQHNRKPAQKS